MKQIVDNTYSQQKLNSARFLVICSLIILSSTLEAVDVHHNLSTEIAEEESQLLTSPWQDGETVMRAFKEAYPEKVDLVTRRKNDWAIRIQDTWFHWSNGRLLPEEELGNAENYTPYPFYPYSKDLEPIRRFTDEEIVQLNERVANRSSSNLSRHTGILDAIWRLDDQRSADQQMKTMYLFGLKFNIHRDLLGVLAKIEEQILMDSRRDRELANYINSLKQISGYVWRNIASSGNRSLHSYGIAVDFTSQSYSAEQVYWYWARESGLPWYNIDYDQRHMPPDSFVKIFEEHGFIWGGKWLFFDTIHFEYRPEILAINGLLEEE